MANYHGPLYDRACSVFQRRVKQVYFQLNPFLERTNLKDDEAECYQPSSKFVIPKSSIVVCEQFDTDEAQDWKVLNPEEFLEYLYSDGWADDCSLRVLEGELLELLKTLLCVLEKNEEVTSHNTFAYAKNKRRVHKCYVDSQDEKEEFADQTLLVEFIYFGVNQKKTDEKKKKEPLVSWRDYKEMAAKAAGLTSLADIVDLMGSNKKKKKEGDFMSLVRAPKSTYMTPQTEDKDIRMEALTAMKFADGFRALSSSRRRCQSVQSPPKIGSGSIVPPPPNPHSTITNTADQNTGNGSDLLAKMDEILFDTSKKVGRSRRANTFFGGLVGRRAPPGDEFYINQLTPKHTEPFLALEYLQQLRQARMTEREKEIGEVKQLTERMKLNKLEYLDDSRHSSDESYKPLMRVYDRRLSFGEFYRYLQDENKYDPRFKKGCSKKKKLSDGIRVRGSKSIANKKSSRATAVVEKPSKKVVSDRQRFANMVGGVTDSEPAKKHCLKNVTSDHKTESHGITKPPPSVGRGRRPNSMFSDTAPSTTHRRFDEQFYTTLPAITSPIFERVSSRSESTDERHTPLGNTGARHNRGYRGGYNKKTPTATEDSDSTDIESEDLPIYDEDDDFEDTVFDSNKLNRKYSIEKIKAMKSKKEKKPPVLNILKKFCRVNKMMNNLAPKPSKSPRKSVADASKAKQSAKAFGMFRRLNKKGMVPEVKPKVEIGKMKHFEFLKHKDYELKIPDVVQPDFKTSSIENFKNNLLNALDDFVIRKEVITSSHNFETVTTVTFTRPAAYVRLHQVPKDS